MEWEHAVKADLVNYGRQAFVNNLVRVVHGPLCVKPLDRKIFKHTVRAIVKHVTRGVYELYWEGDTPYLLLARPGIGPAWPVLLDNCELHRFEEN